MTRHAPMPWRALSALLAVNATLAGVLIVQLRRDPSPVLPPVPVGAPEQAAGTGDAIGTLPSLAPLASYVTVLERPLFLPGRRPFARAEAAAAPPSPAPDGVPTLKGVVVTAEHAVAILVTPDAARYVVGEVGSIVGSWKIEAIGPEGVRLRRGALARLLVLEDRGTHKPVSGAGPTVPDSADRAGPTAEAQSPAPR